jgi:predicted DsbA family dithiol-disulfide isomerase
MVAPMTPLRLIAYSDYLCPWCFNASVRLHRLEEEMDGSLEIEWRSFLLRPHARSGRSLEEFRAYTRSWLRPAQDGDGGTFRVWSTDAGPPSHSVPPHLVAKAAAELGSQSFRDVHDRLLAAYFTDNRDITDRSTLAAIWAEAGLPAAELARADEPSVLDAVLREHNAAVELGITGVPAVYVAGQTAFVIGAQPYETYRRWVDRVIAAP